MRLFSLSRLQVDIPGVVRFTESTNSKYFQYNYGSWRLNYKYEYKHPRVASLSKLNTAII